MIIRPLTLTDLDGAVRLEALWRNKQWNSEQLKSELAHKNSLALGTELKGTIVATLFFRFYKPEAELLRITVCERMRGRKVGSTLLKKGLVHLASNQIETCFLEVRISNLSAQHLYRSCGFEACGRRPNYYTDPTEDAILMKLQLPGS